MRAPSDKFIRRLIWLLLALALFFLGAAFYIPARAMLSRNLLERAWTRTLAEHGRINKPWPWAANWPVARLFIPAHAIDEFVLEGDGMRLMQSGPIRGLQSVVDRNTGTIMISDAGSEQAYLFRDITLGEYIRLQDEDGTVSSFRVQDLEIIDTRYSVISMPQQGKWLLLITNYPNESRLHATSMRYVISAVSASRQTNLSQNI